MEQNKKIKIRTQRFFFDKQPLLTGDLQIANENLLNHFRVLRLQQGDHINLFDGSGKEFHAIILEINKREALIHIKKIEKINRELPFTTCLAQGLCSNERMDWLIEKAVELGAQTIQPLICHKSKIKLTEKRIATKQEHWQKRIIASCEQCGRNVIPKIPPPLSIKEWLSKKIFLESHARGAIAFILSPQNSTSFRNAVPKEQPSHVEILVGPEGGFTQEETELAEQAGYKSANIGPRILRAETAGLTMLAALAAHWEAF